MSLVFHVQRLQTVAGLRADWQRKLRDWRKVAHVLLVPEESLLDAPGVACIAGAAMQTAGASTLSTISVHVRQQFDSLGLNRSTFLNWQVQDLERRQKHEAEAEERKRARKAEHDAAARERAARERAQEAAHEQQLQARRGAS